MDLFKGALYLVSAEPEPAPLGHGFEPEFGNAAATRQWLQDTFGTVPDPAASAPGADPAEPSPEAALEVTG